jgi:hypothetical protein
MCIVNRMEGGSACHGLVESQDTDDNTKSGGYLVFKNLTPLAFVKMLQQNVVRYHVREPIGERWIIESAFFLLEFEVGIHRQIKRLKHAGRGNKRGQVEFIE